MSVTRILVVGATGMLGHEAVRLLAPDFEVWGACRDGQAAEGLGVPGARILAGLDVCDPASASWMLDRVQPDVVLNAVGIVKQHAAAKAAVPSIKVNSLWPHMLADACQVAGVRMIHVSTDCVFSGRRGRYTEDDVPDAADLYGRSKLLGEISDRKHVVTIRTSIVGWQLGKPTGLVAWFAVHRAEPLQGYTRAVFSGLTTRALTEAVRDVILPDPGLSGLWHVSAEPIDKFSLLTTLADDLAWSVQLTPVDKPVLDRSLDSSRFRERTGWSAPAWKDMLQDLAADFDHPFPSQHA
jgi:dTDP-4-dehydrorhamnose reductase